MFQFDKQFSPSEHECLICKHTFRSWTENICSDCTKTCSGCGEIFHSQWGSMCSSCDKKEEQTRTRTCNCGRTYKITEGGDDTNCPSCKEKEDEEWWKRQEEIKRINELREKTRKGWDDIITNLQKRNEERGPVKPLNNDLIWNGSEWTRKWIL